MGKQRRAGDVLGAFMQERNISYKRGAADLGCSVGALWGYVKGTLVPQRYSTRAAIKEWTGGLVDIPDWDAPKPSRLRRRQRKEAA